MAEGFSGERSELNCEYFIIRYRTAHCIFKGRWSLGAPFPDADVPTRILKFPDIIVQIGSQSFGIDKEDRERFLAVMRTSNSMDVDFKVVLDTESGQKISLDAHGHFESVSHDPPSIDPSDIATFELSNYSALLENIPVAMLGSWTFIPRGNLFLWSDGMYNMFGVPRGETVAPEIYLERVVDDDRPIAEKLVKSIREGLVFDDQLDIVVDGAVRSLRVISTPRHIHGELFVIGIDINVTDVNCRQRLARANTLTQEALAKTKSELEPLIHNYVAQLNREKAKLEIANQELEAMTFAASHELIEPLRKIRIFAQRVLTEEHDNLTNKGRDHFRRMLYSVQLMGDLVSAISKYSNYKEDVSHAEPINLEIMLSSLRRFLTPMLDQIGASFDFEVADGLQGNYDQVKQVIYNLISNAMKFGRKQIPLRIQVKGKLVQGKFVTHDRADKNKLYYQIEVVDNGIGFDPRYSKYIFDLFRKLHGRFAYPGTGIGLTIVRKIIENHSGFVAVESTPGIGSAFYCYFPVG